MEFLTVIIIPFIVWKWGDWKNWNKYYSTILYFIIGDLVYNFLTYNSPLWKYEPSIMNSTLADLLIAVVVFPSTVLLFLPYLPGKLTKQIIHIAKWVAIYSAIEWIYYSLGFISYHNNWNIGWSILFYFIMFSLLWLHYKRPLWVWPISMALAFLTLYIFGIPFGGMR